MKRFLYLFYLLFIFLMSCTSINQLSNSEDDIRESKEYSTHTHQVSYSRIDYLFDGAAKYQPEISYSHFRWFHTGTPHYFYPLIMEKLNHSNSSSGGVIMSGSRRNVKNSNKGFENPSANFLRQSGLKNKNNNYSIILPKNYIKAPQISAPQKSSSGYSGGNSGGSGVSKESSSSDSSVNIDERQMKNSLNQSDKKVDITPKKELENEPDQIKDQDTPKEKFIITPDKKKIKSKKIKKERIE